MEIQNSKLKSQNKCIIFAFCILVLTLFTGCARTVTQIVTYGDQMLVEVTLRGTMEFNANRYFLIVSTNESYKIPLPPPDIIEAAPEFIEPGMTPQLGTPEAYYSNFYSTWSGYVILDPSGYSLVKGPFVAGEATTREVLSTLADIGTKISFSFRLGRMFDAVPDQIYFDFIAVPWPDGEAKIPSDHLPSTGNYISKVSGSIFAIDDLSDSTLDASLDIVRCRVEVQ
jgi:hypothetical protein